MNDQPTRSSLAGLKQQAIRHHEQGEFKRAIGGYKHYLNQRPDDAGCWSNLGAALRKQGQYQSAVNCYQRALELRPDDTGVLGNLANVLKDQHRLADALQLHARVIARQPSHPQSLINYACALREAGQFEHALQQLDNAKSLQPDDPGVEWERAQNLLHLGRYQQAWPAYEARWQTGELPARRLPFPQWCGEPLTGKRLLLHSEQGFGDTILAARCVPLLKQRGAHITLQCKPQLHRLFEYLGADEIITDVHSESAAGSEPHGASFNVNDTSDSYQETVTTSTNRRHANRILSDMRFDYHCPMMSVLGALDITVGTIPPPPPLQVPESSLHTFEHLQQHARYLNIGIVWSGSLTFANNANRAVALERFLPLAEIPGVRLHSLQKGPGENELYITGADSYISNLGAHCQDFADTAAAIKHLDLIVMTDSSVAHLAASLGKPVINLLQCVPYWLYALEDTSTPWYPSMTLMKQPTPGDWDTVFDCLNQHIRKAVQCHRSNRQQYDNMGSLPLSGSKQYQGAGTPRATQIPASSTQDVTE